MTVKVAYGRKMTSMHVCLVFTWWVQHHKFTFDFRILEMRSFDIILGVNWMQVFNNVLFDFHNTKVTIMQQGMQVVL